MRFVTTQEAHTSLTGVAAHRGPGAFGVDLDARRHGLLRGRAVPIDVTTDETAFGWGEDSSQDRRRRQPRVGLGPTGPACLTGRADGRAQRGSSTQTLVPSPSVLSSDTTPPWASTMLRTIVRPRPVPGTWSRRAFSPR